MQQDAQQAVDQNAVTPYSFAEGSGSKDNNDKDNGDSNEYY